MESLEAALARLVETANTLPGAYRPEFELGYWAGVDAAEADPWYVRFEGDLMGDDGSAFFLTGRTATDVLARAHEEAWRRVGGDLR